MSTNTTHSPQLAPRQFAADPSLSRATSISLTLADEAQTDRSVAIRRSYYLQQTRGIVGAWHARGES